MHWHKQSREGAADEAQSGSSKTPLKVAKKFYSLDITDLFWNIDPSHCGEALASASPDSKDTMKASLALLDGNRCARTSDCALV